MTINDMDVGQILKLGTFCMEKYGERGYAPHDIEWVKASSNCDFITKYIEAHFAFDAPETGNSNPHRAAYGSNCYPQSNINQYLNSEKDNWYCPSHDDDSPPASRAIAIPYLERSGFLAGFEEWERNLIIPREIACQIPSGSRASLGGEVTISCKVSLPSAIEIGIKEQDDSESDVPFEWFVGSKTETRFHPKLGSYLYSMISLSSQMNGAYLLRTVNTKSDCANQFVDRYGIVCQTHPHVSLGIRPVIRLNQDCEVMKDNDGCFVCVNPEDSNTSNVSLETILFNDN